MKLSEELKARGFIYQYSSESLEEILDGEKRTVYLGIDPTADAIHVGNLVPFLLLNHLMRAGHTVYLLLGGGTALIGDPSGKDTERELSEVSLVQERAEKMKEAILPLTEGNSITFVNNYSWLSQLSAIEFMRDVGKHFTVNAMLKKDSVSARLSSEQGISYTEFSYALLQSYDFYHLHKEYGCDLQIGGSDQWGNLISGVDYIRRVTGDTVYALTVQLIIDKATGKKFGKSMGNAVWLDAEKTSPYSFYQFWFNTSDENVVEYLKLFTFLPLEEIEQIEKEFSSNPGSQNAQAALAHHVTAFVHGEQTALSVARVSNILFSGGDINTLSPAEKEILMSNAPMHELGAPANIVDIIVAAGLATSKREARTFIESGAVVCGDQKITSADHSVSMEAGEFLPLKRGKKNFVILHKV